MCCPIDMLQLQTSPTSSLNHGMKPCSGADRILIGAHAVPQDSKTPSKSKRDQITLRITVNNLGKECTHFLVCPMYRKII